MIDLAPLLLLWAIGSKKRSTTNVPAWPTAVSPPPPPPAPSMPSHPAESGTPLSELHATAQHAAPPTTTIRDELRKTAAALKNVPDVHTTASQLLKRAKAPAKARRLLKGIVHAPAVGPPAPAQETVSVADLQAALVRRGYNVARDGIYGPKTAAAWKSAANANHLSPMISRAGSRTARVAAHTFDVLSVPAIP